VEQCHSRLILDILVSNFSLVIVYADLDFGVFFFMRQYTEVGHNHFLQSVYILIFFC
jgi:hypothetical protein